MSPCDRWFIVRDRRERTEAAYQQAVHLVPVCLYLIFFKVLEAESSSRAMESSDFGLGVTQGIGYARSLTEGKTLRPQGVGAGGVHYPSPRKSAPLNADLTGRWRREFTDLSGPSTSTNTLVNVSSYARSAKSSRRSAPVWPPRAPHA